jgi:ATP-dependent helicase/DNAse subunit B
VPTGRKEILKTPEMIEALRLHTYSASSINMYIRNPMEFYYNYVLGLREKEDLLDEPENRQLGIFMHELLEDTFKKFLGKKPKINAAFRNYFKKIADERFTDTLGKSMKSDAFLLKTVLDTRLEHFLNNEEKNRNGQIKEIMFLEHAFRDEIPLSCGNMRFVYKLDRVERMEDESILVLDYKTGSIDPMPKGIEHIETMKLSRESVYENIKSFQIPLYFYYLNKYFKNDDINAAFYNLRTCETHKFIDKKMRYDRERINKAFLRALDFVMCEILDSDVPFVEGEIL